MSEIEVARPLVSYLRMLQWDVHQEVSGPTGRIDVVAVHGSIVHAIEVKVALTFGVMRQALEHRKHVHFTSVAVPPAWRSQERRFAYGVAKSYGIGVYEVREATREDAYYFTAALRSPDMLLRHFGAYGPPVHQVVRPVLLRRPHTAPLVKCLCEATRTYAEAGNAESKFWSPFKATCAAIVEALRGGPLTNKELVAAIQHHYANDSSARSTLPRMLAAGAIPGVRPMAGAFPLRWELDA